MSIAATGAKSPDNPPQRPVDDVALEFERKSMVQWFDPSILADAALRVVLSSVFGAYSDKRETQAAIVQPSYEYVPGDDGALWIDFVADLGDGFDSTYAVASLLGRQRLQLDGEGAPELPRGRVLVMGGDQVYPSPTREDYESKFRGPYSAALPWTQPGSSPDLFAIPGNHDWYDGLTNFVRFFCAGRWIGGWQTPQKRSYFALRLPHRWWLLALDIQLDTYIDDPQMDYFRAVGVQSGDRVIVVTGKPSWIKVAPEVEVPESYQNLQYFKDKIVHEVGAEVAVTLTGDLHHYCRYEGEDDSQLITAGGGGAYLFPTHTMPRALTLPDEPQLYEQAACWPSAERSGQLARGALRFPWLAPGLCSMIAVLHAAFAASLFAGLDGYPASFVLVALVGLLTLGSLSLYAAFEKPIEKLLWGGLHAAIQLAPAAAAALFADRVLDAGGAWATLAVAAVVAVGGYFVGGLIFALYLILIHRKSPQHANDVFACQSIPDYKNFLRLRIDEGGLTIYPIGIERVPREWKYAPKGAPSDPWLEPADGELTATLIEKPIPVRGAHREAEASG